MQKKIWKEYFLTLLVAVTLALIVRTFLLTAYKVPTGSMQPSLKPGDFIFALRTAYGLKIPGVQQTFFTSPPNRGDLVVFTYPQQPNILFIKRVVAIAGDRIEVRDGKLILNEQPMEYQRLDSSVDNPNPEMFDLYQEKSAESQRVVILMKQHPADSKNFGPQVVAPNEVFLMGDNRDASDDSRYWGAVPSDHILGKALFIWLSLDYQNKWARQNYPSLRWKRIFSSIH